MLLLICAATGTEARACRAALEANWLLEAGARAEVLVTGVGMRRARAAIARRLASHKSPSPALVISSGFAGAITPELAATDWVVSEEVYDSRAVGRPSPIAPADSADSSLLRQAVLGAFASARRARVVSVERIETQSLPAFATTLLNAAGTPLAVDMESAALATECAQRGVPFLVLRFVTDTPAAPLPRFVSEFTDVMCAPTKRARAGALVAGMKDVLKKPAIPMRFVQQGIRWSKRLAEGWSRGLKLKQST